MKRTLIIALLLLGTLSGQAQWRGGGMQMFRPSEHTVIFGAGAGVGQLLVTTQGNRGSNMNASFGYTYLFHESWGIHVGMTYSQLKSGYEQPMVLSTGVIDQVELWDNIDDYHGPADRLSTTLPVKEELNFSMLELPVQLSYSSSFFWINAGVRFVLPMSIKSHYDYGATSHAVTHLYTTETYFDEPVPVRGLVTEAASGEYNVHKITDGFKAFVTACVEGGIRIPMSNMSSIYLGVYVDYALNKVSVDNTNAFLTLYDDGSVTFHGLFSSSAGDDYKFFNYGVKAYYALGVGDVGVKSFRRRRYSF